MRNRKSSKDDINNERLKSNSSNISLVTIFIIFILLGTISFLLFDRNVNKLNVTREKVIDKLEDETIITAMSHVHSYITSKSKLSLEELEKLRKMLVSPSLSNIDTIYVIPGGGGGVSEGENENKGIGSKIDYESYPEWSRRRVLAAYEASLKREDLYKYEPKEKNNDDDHNNNNVKFKSIFLALSAGSMNSPNVLFDDGSIMFESQHMMQHLKDLGISKERVFGDFISWDTVTNALVTRMFIEGVLAIKKKSDIKDSLKNNINSKNNLDNDIIKLKIEIYISDFHAERMKTAMKWILDLEPSILDKDVELAINVVGSEGIVWDDKEGFNNRLIHEQQGVASMKENMNKVTTITELYAFIFLGGHRGIFNYMNGDYKKSNGVGW